MANTARGVACLGLAGSSLRPGLPAGARWVLSAAWCWPGVGLSAGRAGDAGDAGGSCRRAEVEEYAAWSLLQFDNRQTDFESQQLDA